jgi:proteasome lid subunit RPN8/RPN11
VIPQRLFRLTLARLAQRSAGWRESAAIWIGNLNADDAIASEVLFHHELCDDRGSPFSMELTERAKFDLYRRLAAGGKKLVGMIHTHPEEWVELSPIDQENQICSRIGFWSLVVPWYGRPPWDLETMGVHVRADSGWHQYLGAEISGRVIIPR